MPSGFASFFRSKGIGSSFESEGRPGDARRFSGLLLPGLSGLGRARSRIQEGPGVTAEIVTALWQVPLLAALDEQALERLAQDCSSRTYASDQVVFLQGEPGEEFFLVVEGAIRIALETVSGREVTVAIRRRGSFVGEMALLDGQPRSASGYAQGELQCLVLHRQSFEQLLTRESGAARALLTILCQRLRQSSERLEEVAVRTIRQRLAITLARLALEDGEPHGTGVLLGRDVNYRMLLGLMCTNRESVSRAAASLIDEGLLERRGRRFLVPDLAALREAGFS